MKTLRAMQASQIRKFARFLAEHPGFSPELMGENAYVYGFRVGECLLSLDEMDKLIGTPVEGWWRGYTRPPTISKRCLP